MNTCDIDPASNSIWQDLLPINIRGETNDLQREQQGEYLKFFQEDSSALDNTIKI